MIDDEQPLFTVGHNSGDMREMAIAQQREALQGYEDRKAQFIAAARKAIFRDRQDAADAGDIVKLAAAVWKKIEGERLETSNPYRETANALAAGAEEFWQPVKAEMEELQRRIDLYLTEQDALITRQRDEQRQAEETLREKAGLAPVDSPQAGPPPIPARKQRLRGAYGAVVTQKDVKVFEIEDVRAVPDYIMNTVAVREAIIQVARLFEKQIKIIPGIRISVERDGIRIS